MIEPSELRAWFATLTPERRRRMLAAGTTLLLAAAVATVVLEPERGLTLLVLTLGVGVLIARPHWAVLAIFALVVFRIDLVRVGPFGTSELLAAPLMLPLALQVIRDRQVWVWRVPQVRLLAAIGGVLLVATEWSLLAHPAPPFEGPDGPWSTLTLFGQQLLFLLCLVYFIRTPRHLAYAAAMLLVMVLAAAVDSLDLLEAGHGGERARVSQGWAANSNRLAFLCVWGTALAWALRFKGPRGWWRPLTLVPLLGLPVTTLMTGSRNGLLQLLLLGGLILLEQRQWSPAQRVRAFTLMAIAGALVLVLAPAAMMQRASRFDEASVSDRMATHQAGLRMVAEHPFLGVGPGNFHWRNHEMTGHRMSTHDSYLWALTTGGPLLLGLFLVLFHRTYRMLRAVEQQASAEFAWLATALRFNLVVLLAFSFFADLWLTHPVYLLLGLAIALSRIAAVHAALVMAASVPRAAPAVAWASRYGHAG